MNLSWYLPDMSTVLLIMGALFITAAILASAQSIRGGRLELQRLIATLDRDLYTRETELRTKLDSERELQLEIEQLKKKAQNHVEAAERVRRELDEFLVPFKFTSTILGQPKRDGERAYFFNVANPQIVKNAPTGSQARCWRKGRRYLVFGIEARDAWNQLENKFPRQSGYTILPD